MSPTTSTRTAFTGLGIVSAIGDGVDSFADSLRSGTSGIALREREGHALLGGPQLGATVEGFSLEAALRRLEGAAEEKARASKSARRAPRIIQTAVAAVLEAWSAARLGGMPCEADRVAIIVAGNNVTQGIAHRAYTQHAGEPAFTNPKYALQFMDTHHVGVLSEILGSQGEGFSVGAASASGNVGIIKGLQAIRSGACDVCVVVGAMTELSPFELQAFQNIGAMPRPSSTEAAAVCRPFDRGHEGFVPGEASACVVLERYDHAVARGATVLAELTGGALVLDANSSSNPNADGESRAMMRALADAGVTPDAIDYVNAHGTSSVLGDDTEIAALKRVFGPAVGGAIINATKALTGHCLSSAGVVEAIATIVQMQRGFVHANPNLHDPIDAECQFVGRTSEQRDLHRAISNSFGFGGINSCIVIERHPKG